MTEEDIKVELKGEHGSDGVMISADNVHIHLPAGHAYIVERAGPVMVVTPINQRREAE